MGPAFSESFSVHRCWILLDMNFVISAWEFSKNIPLLFSCRGTFVRLLGGAYQRDFRDHQCIFLKSCVFWVYVRIRCKYPLGMERQLQKKKKKKPWRFLYLTETQVQCDHFTQNKQWKYHTPARNFCFVEKFSPRDSDLLKLQLRKLTSFAVYIHLGRASSAAWCTRSHVPVRAVVVIVGQTLIKAFWCDGLECWLASLAHGRLYSLTNRCVLCFLGTRFHSGPSNLDAWRWYLGLDWELLTSRMRQQWSIGHRPARK